MEELYSCKPQYCFITAESEKEEADTSLLSRNFEKEVYSVIEKDILRALFRYQYLNTPNINRQLKASLPEYITKTDFLWNIKRLYKDGFLYRHTYTNKEQKKEGQCLVAYSLKKEAYYYVTRLPGSYKTYEFQEPSKIKNLDETIMESLSIAQWHIAISTTYQPSYSRYMIKKPYRSTYATIPSIFKVKAVIGNNKNVTPYTLIALSIFKSKDKLKESISRLLRIRGLISEFPEEYPNNLVLFTTDTLESAITAAEYLRALEETRDFPFLYILDINTITESPLDFVQVLEEKDGKYISTPLSFGKIF